MAARLALDDWQAAKTSGNGQAGPLAKKLAALAKTATPIDPASTVDSVGQVIAPDKLALGLGDSLPFVRLGFDLSGVQADEAVSLELQPGLPIRKLVFLPSQSIQDGTLTVTLADRLTPQLFDRGAYGSPDYVIPPAPNARQYEPKHYIRADARMKLTDLDTVGYENAPISEAFWSLFAYDPGFENPERGSVSLLHYNQNANDWDELPNEKGLCDLDTGWCQYTARSSGFSYFAIVVKKSTSPAAYILPVLFWGGLGYLLVRFIRRRRKHHASPTAPTAKDVPSWPRRHPVITLIATILIVSASIFVIVIATGPRARQQLAVILFSGGVAWLIYLFKKHARDKISK